MSLLKYIRYFFYLGFNWNIPVAIHMVRNEIRGEKKYGIHTTGEDDLDHLEKKGIDISHATIYMPAGYDMLEALFEQPAISHSRYLLDIGCGKGRILCVAAHFGFTNLTGIEISKKFCMEAENNLQLTQSKFPAIHWKIFNNDAFYYEIPDETDCIFLFNPFDEIILSGVIENIESSIQRNPRTINIAYINPMHKSLLLQHGYSEIFYRCKMKYLEAGIYSKAFIRED